MTVLPLNLFLVDEDPVFRLGLRIWLEQRPEFAIAGEASTAEETLTQLTNLRAAAVSVQADAAAMVRDQSQGTIAGPEITGVDVVILDLGLGLGDPEQLPGLRLCGDLKTRFPDLPILVLSAQGDPVLQAAAQAMGADGFGLRGLPVRDLAMLIQHTAQRTVPTPALNDPPEETRPRSGWVNPLVALRRSGLAQIATAIAEVETEQAQASLWYRPVLQGRHRELRAARWLVTRILPEAPAAASGFQSSSSTSMPPASIPAMIAPPSTASSPLSQSSSSGTAMPMAITAVTNGRTRVCEAVFRKLQYSLDNQSDIPLEIDILRVEKRRELLYLLLRAFEDVLDDLAQAQLPPGQVATKAPTLLRDLWLTGLTDFFGRYYTATDSDLEGPMVEVLRQEEATVKQGILAPIPGVADLVGHLLFQDSVVVDGTAYIATAPEALRRSQLLLENLLIQVACGVIQPLLNRCADTESFKRTLYQRRMMSSRDIARFRNDLSWRYRWQRWVSEPKAIFESQHQLFAFAPEGIQTQWIYAPRQAELETLSGVQYTLTLAMEARDAISPRLRAAIAFVGSGVVYVLTEVVGRGIGLVGRGILKGVGSAWQEGRLRSRSRDEV
ncbi:DUF3685 domain-containing protein [Leptolyngbya sp. PCC 6406]|uniref:DUF3685 domain-containing protein n=1 Tax=Leptolyngbya sp. PCC 6406 TaxID=1173264 RepID=UPI0002AC7D0B|nr:DUF3685 domain-containing protein [Leptolyngbya sp. PCC 6406]